MTILTDAVAAKSLDQEMPKLQSMLSASSAGTPSAEQPVPHHPITCNAGLRYFEDGSLACAHATTSPDDLRTKYCVDHSIALLLVELAHELSTRRDPPGPTGGSDMEATRPSLGQAIYDAKAARSRVRDCMTNLEGVLTGPVGADESAWWYRVLVSLDALREAFGRHVAVTETPGGVLDEIVADAPRLAHARDHLVHDHVEISAALDRLCRPTLPPGGVDTAREEALDLLGLLSRHRHRGADFLYDAYDVDIGGGD